MASDSFKRLLLMLALCLATSLQAQARVMQARVATISNGAGSLEDVRLRLDWPDGAAGGTLTISAASVSFPSLGYAGKKVLWNCPLQRRGAGWHCAGTVAADGSKAQRLALDLMPGRTELLLGIDGSQLRYVGHAATPERAHVQLEQVPVAWLKSFLAGLWQQARWTSGKVGGSVDVSTAKKGPFRVRADLAFKDLGLETPDGLIAAAALRGRMLVDYRDAAGAQDIDAQFTVDSGELLAGSFYAKFPKSPVLIHVQAQRAKARSWQLPLIAWQDPGVLTATGSAALDSQASIDDLDMQLDIGNLALARDRYLSGFLAPAGFADLLLTGSLSAHGQMRKGSVVDARATFGNINAVDTKARFTFAGIDGGLHWTRGTQAVSSDVGWHSGALFGIGLGAARFPLDSSAGQLRLRSPVAIDALQGRLLLDHLRWQAPAGDTGAQVQFGLGMDAMDLGSLSQRLGWPAFTGTLSGRIPSATLKNDVLTMDGGVHMKLFGGSVDLQSLVMERPFGAAPTLSADIALQDIDLEPMTRVFGFGSITGRLDGEINHLRLLDWSPVAFEARLRTDKAWKGKRRISQRAVSDISSVGGGGIAGGLQMQLLKIFNDFGYDQIGIGCALKDNVCTMDGLGSAGDGYIIVAGAGLPRIQVVGFRRKVDWPTLVSRLQAATNGQAPVIK